MQLFKLYFVALCLRLLDTVLAASFDHIDELVLLLDGRVVGALACFREEPPPQRVFEMIEEDEILMMRPNDAEVVDVFVQLLQIGHFERDTGVEGCRLLVWIEWKDVFVVSVCFEI